MSTVRLSGISKSYGRLPVLAGLDCEVPEGAVVAVLGKSGSGKTTLLRLVAGFERPDEGTIEIDEDVVDSAQRFVPPERRRVGYVAQEGNLFPHLTVEKNVAFGLSRAERAGGRAEELLALVGLADMGRRYPHQLSGGQQQRVALARALAPRPRVVLLDEPFSSLDAGLRASLRSDVMQLLREQHATTVFVTHDQEEALSVADLVGVMEGGRIRQFAAPEDLYARPLDRTVAEFVGEANILAGHVSSGWADTALGRLRVADALLPNYDGPASVLVRPEQITLRRPAGSSEEPAGTVLQREFYGHDCLLVVGFGATRLRVRCPGRPPAEVGEKVVLSASGEVACWPAPG